MLQCYKFQVQEGAFQLKSLSIDLPGKNYEITIRRGILNNIGENLKKIYNGNKIFIISDKNVYSLYGEKVKSGLESNSFTVDSFIMKPGEKSKCINVLEKVYDALVDSGITRGDMIIALGGGVVGDLAGFAASTYLRGIPFIQIPTSLLAQIDSSIGGKVAVDLEKGKNLVGSFYHPKAVFIDPDVLNTLDKRFLHDGMAEVIKYGAIRSENLFNKLVSIPDDESLLNNIEDIIYECCSIKKSVVEIDEKDTGERMTLNFGHTIGHAIEKYYKYEKYTHGEAVAAGMYMITYKSEKLGLTEAGTAEKIKSLLIKYMLPYNISEMPKNVIKDTISKDKKKNRDRLNLIILKRLGENFINNIAFDEVEKYI